MNLVVCTEAISDMAAALCAEAGIAAIQVELRPLQALTLSRSPDFLSVACTPSSFRTVMPTVWQSSRDVSARWPTAAWSRSTSQPSARR